MHVVKKLIFEGGALCSFLCLTTIFVIGDILLIFPLVKGTINHAGAADAAEADARQSQAEQDAVNFSLHIGVVFTAPTLTSRLKTP